MRKCSNCRHFTLGVTDEERRRLDPGSTNFGRYADGICHLDFPRGYIGRKAPHLARSSGCCFQFERNTLPDLMQPLEEMSDGPS